MPLPWVPHVYLTMKDIYINDSNASAQRGCFSIFPIWTAVTLGSLTFRYKVIEPMNSSSGFSQTLGRARRVDRRSWTCPAAGIGLLALSTTNHPLCLDNVAAPSTWDNYTNHTGSSPLPGRPLVPPTTIDAPDAAPTIERIPFHSPYILSFESSHSTTDFAISLLKPLLAHGSTVILPRIETHVYLNVGLPSRSWNAIQLPCTKSVTSDDSPSIDEGIRPLPLVITVRGATTRQERNRVCEHCEKRIGNKIRSPDLIDFHGPSNILTPKHGMVQVHFTFSCYSRHHRKEDEQYVYVVVAQ